MGPAAGDHFKIPHGDDPDMLRDGRLFPQGKGGEFRLIREPAADRRILPDPVIDGILEQGDLLIRQTRPFVRQRDVDGGILSPQMQADGGSAELFPHGTGQHMLTTVLLHMVQPPGDVNLPADFRAGRDFPVDQVPYLAGRIRFHIQHMGFPAREDEPPGIEGLPAGGGIKGAAVQGNQPSAGFLCGEHGGNGCGEGPQVCVIVIQAFGHAISSGWKAASNSASVRNPSATQASFRPVPSRWAFWAVFAAFS